MSSETYWTQANLDAELVDLSGQAFLWLGERRSVAMQVTVLQHSHFPSVTARCVNPDERPLRIWTRSFVLRGQTLGDANPDDATPLEVLRMPPWELEGNNLTVVQVRRWSLLPILAIIVSATVLAAARAAGAVPGPAAGMGAQGSEPSRWPHGALARGNAAQ